VSSSGVPTIKILVIDSNVFFARRITEALKLEGFDVVHCTQSGYALTMLEYDTPSAILCSNSLREMNAYELPAILTADPKSAHIPVIAMGEGGDQGLMEAFRSGCADYIDKRLGPELIASQVKTFLRSNAEGFQPVQMLGSSDTALSGSLSHMDLPGVLQMLAHSRQTGSLYINAGSIDGIVFFENGNVTHAELGDLIGEEAVVSIVKYCNTVEAGSYKFLPGESAGTHTVLRSATELMLEALRELDEAAQDGADGGFVR
jgi:twitching motility two-component system response regulator PilH